MTSQGHDNVQPVLPSLNGVLWAQHQCHTRPWSHCELDVLNIVQDCVLVFSVILCRETITECILTSLQACREGFRSYYQAIVQVGSSYAVQQLQCTLAN